MTNHIQIDVCKTFTGYEVATPAYDKVPPHSFFVKTFEDATALSEGIQRDINRQFPGRAYIYIEAWL